MLKPSVALCWGWFFCVCVCCCFSITKLWWFLFHVEHMGFTLCLRFKLHGTDINFHLFSCPCSVSIFSELSSGPSDAFGICKLCHYYCQKHHSLRCHFIVKMFTSTKSIMFKIVHILLIVFRSLRLLAKKWCVGKLDAKP